MALCEHRSRLTLLVSFEFVEVSAKQSVREVFVNLFLGNTFGWCSSKPDRTENKPR